MKSLKDHRVIEEEFVEDSNSKLKLSQEDPLFSSCATPTPINYNSKTFVIYENQHKHYFSDRWTDSAEQLSLAKLEFKLPNVNN